MSKGKIGAIVLVVIVIAIGGAVMASRKLETSEYCGSCHTMEPYYESWKISGHSSVQCVECHTGSGLAGWVRGKLDLQRMERAEKEGKTPAAMEIDDDFCLRCHPKPESIAETASLKIPHVIHGSDMGLDCQSCHGGQVHGPEGTAPTKMSHGTCIGCHGDEIRSADSADCEKCHKPQGIVTTGAVPVDHELHSSMLGCRDCHLPRVEGKPVPMTHAQCIDCHADEIENDTQCATCHQMASVNETADFHIPHEVHAGMLGCTDCHGVQAVDGQIAEKAEMSHDTCDSCHADEIEDYDKCETCHKW